MEGNFLFFSPSDCCVRWSLRSLNSERVFPSDAPTRPHTHTRTPCRAPPPALPHSSPSVSWKEAWHGKLCALWDHGTAPHLVFVTLSSSKNIHSTNSGCTWEQFISSCVICLLTSWYCLGNELLMLPVIEVKTVCLMRSSSGVHLLLGGSKQGKWSFSKTDSLNLSEWTAAKVTAALENDGQLLTSSGRIKQLIVRNSWSFFKVFSKHFTS